MGNLVLTRRPGEKIILKIGDDLIEIAIIQSCYGQSKISIDAPHYVEINREEIHNKIYPLG